MRRVRATHGLAALAAVILLLAATSCNSVGEQADAVEAVIEVKSITYGGTSLASTEPVTAALSLTLLNRAGDAATPVLFNDVTFTSYSVAYPTDPTPPNVPDTSVSATTCIFGKDCSLSVAIIDSGSKPAAGTLVTGVLTVQGHDQRDRMVEFSANLSFSMVP
ncbi:MAG TPA: hypothetical protein VNL37_01195 [Candidatus Polarisedimenticolia bacterium]|nr:hypothetical protein [Candidatus Polarisedimenticolia bacterium]